MLLVCVPANAFAEQYLPQAISEIIIAYSLLLFGISVSHYLPNSSLITQGEPGQTVTPDIGIKVTAHNPEQTVKDLAAAMVKLAKNPDLCVQMGQQGQKRIRKFYSWEAKA